MAKFVAGEYVKHNTWGVVTILHVKLIKDGVLYLCRKFGTQITFNSTEVELQLIK